MRPPTFWSRLKDQALDALDMISAEIRVERQVLAFCNKRIRRLQKRSHRDPSTHGSIQLAVLDRRKSRQKIAELLRAQRRKQARIAYYDEQLRRQPKTAWQRLR